MKASLVGGIACVIASSCFAQAEPKLYMSGDLGWTNAQPERGCSGCDYDAGVWRITAGYKVLPQVAIEAGWRSLGRARLSGPTVTGDLDGSIRFNGWFVGPAAYFDVMPKVRLGARMGYAVIKSRIDASVTSVAGEIKSSDTDFTNYFGADLTYQLTRELGVYTAFDYMTADLADYSNHPTYQANLNNADYEPLRRYNGRTYRFKTLSVGLRYSF